MDEHEKFDDPYSKLILNEDACFLCGVDLSENKTEEHVFPRWLQRRHNLWDQRLGLLNDTVIPYRQLKVPCCTKCNNKYLSVLEQTVSEAVERGYEACAELDELTVFQWLGKIYFGILRKELTLLMDRADSAQGTIVPPELIEGFDTLHGFLQSIRQPVKFSVGAPFSVLVVNLHDLGEGRDYFFRDSIDQPAASLRTKDVGFIVAFEDAGISRFTHQPYLEKVAGRKLHPIQFDELYARVLYQVYRLNRPLTYITALSDNPDQAAIVLTMTPGGYSTAPVLTEWNSKEFAQILIQVVHDWLDIFGVDPELVFLPPNSVLSWLTDEEDDPSLWDLHGNPLPPDPTTPPPLKEE